MEGIILAGGFGTRLRELVPDLPKPMAPVAGRPFLELVLSALSRKGFTRVVLSLGFMAEKVRDHFGESFAAMTLIYEVESKPLGTGGAIRAALRRCTSDHVFIFNGDTYLDIEIDALEHAWQVSRRPIIVVREVPDTSRFGRVEMLDGLVKAFLEKGMSGPGLINAGCYVIPRDALDGFELGYPFSLETEFFTPSIGSMDFEGFVTHGCFIDIGVPEDYRLAQTELAGL